MARTRTFYLLDSAASGSSHGSLQSEGSAPTAATTGTGATVGKTGASNYTIGQYNSERANNTFGATAQPAAGSLSTNDAFRSQNLLSGTFESGNWTIAVAVRAVTNAATGTGRLRFRLYRSTSQTGSSATEITASAQVSSTYSNLLTSADQNLSVTFNPGAVTLTNEYLFLQFAFETVTASGSNSADCLIRLGSNSKITTSNFFPEVNETSVAVTDAGSREVVFARESNDTVSVTDSCTASLEKTSQVQDSVSVTDQGSRQAEFGRIASDSVSIADQGTEFPYLASLSLKGLWLATYPNAPWPGSVSVGGVTEGRSLVTSGIDPTQGTAINRRIPAVFVAYTPPNHPLRFNPTTFYQRPFYNGQSGQWTGLTNVATVLAASGTAPYEAAGAPLSVNTTSDFLANATGIASWAGTGTKHIYARVKTTSITSTSAFYSAHAIITDSNQSLTIGLRKNGSNYEAGFLDYDGGVRTAVVDITAIVDSSGAGEFSIQAKRTSGGDLFIRANGGAWQAGSTGIGATSGGGTLEVGGGTNSAELNGEILVLGTWAGSNLADDDSNWLATWEPPVSAWDFATAPSALYFPRRYNDTLNGGLGYWYNSVGVANTGKNLIGANGETNPPAVPSSTAGSPDFEDSVPHAGMLTGAWGASLEWIGGVSADFTTFAWVRPESITLTNSLGGANPWFNHAIWVDTSGFVGLYLYKNGSNFYAYLYCFDSTTKTAAIDITSLVDSNGAGEFTIAAKRVSGVMSISVNGGSWTSGDTCTTLGGGAATFYLGRYGATANGYFDGIIYGVGAFASYVISDQEKTDIETMAASLFDETEEATLLLKKGNYAISSGTGTWTATIGTNATESTLEPSDSSGVPDFNGGDFASGTFLASAMTFANLFGSGDHCGYGVVDLDAVSARAAGGDYTNRSLWGFGDVSGGSASTMLLAIISDSGTPKAEFTTWSSGYARATVTLPRSTGKIFVAWRRWKGRLWVSCDGATWTQGDTSSVTSIASGSLIVGKGPDQFTDGSLDGRVLELQFVKGVGRGVQWLKGAYARAQREHNVP